MKPQNKLFLAVVIAAIACSATATPAQANQPCAGGLQSSAPIAVVATVCIDDTTGHYVSSYGYVYDTYSGARVTHCTLYTKVWHNATLVAEVPASASGECGFGNHPWWSRSRPRPARGTYVTAQRHFDVRYVLAGRTYTKRSARVTQVL